MANPVSWFEIYVQDMDRARAFYEKVFGVQLNAMDTPEGLTMYAFPQTFDQYGSGGALVKGNNIAPSKDGTQVYFACEDCGVEGSRIEAAGGLIEAHKTSIGEHGFVVMAIDTEGNRIGLHSMA